MADIFKVSSIWRLKDPMSLFKKPDSLGVFITRPYWAVVHSHIRDSVMTSLKREIITGSMPVPGRTLEGGEELRAILLLLDRKQLLLRMRCHHTAVPLSQLSHSALWWPEDQHVLMLNNTGLVLGKGF